jgi:hypothetical protein
MVMSSQTNYVKTQWLLMQFLMILHHWKNVKLSAWFMVLFAVTSSTSAWDWLMSIDVHIGSLLYMVGICSQECG